MMKMPLGDFRRGTLDQPAVPVRGIHVAPNICYEDLFGEEIAATLRQQATPANMLANVTNLAWFGDTIALDQHLQISRMRAGNAQAHAACHEYGHDRRGGTGWHSAGKATDFPGGDADRDRAGHAGPDALHPLG
jgi:hypothetical protein